MCDCASEAVLLPPGAGFSASHSVPGSGAACDRHLPGLQHSQTVRLTNSLVPRTIYVHTPWPWAPHSQFCSIYIIYALYYYIYTVHPQSAGVASAPQSGGGEEQSSLAGRLTQSGGHSPPQQTVRLPEPVTTPPQQPDHFYRYTL